MKIRNYFMQANKGFTLVETIMYIAIMGMVITSFVSFSLSIAATRNKNYAVEEVQSNARIIMSFLTDKIRESTGVVMPTNGEESIILELEMPGANGNLVFSVNDGMLMAVQGEDDPIFVSSSEVEITLLDFKNLAYAEEKDSVAISLSLKYRFNSAPEFSYFYETQTAVNTRL